MLVFVATMLYNNPHHSISLFDFFLMKKLVLISSALALVFAGAGCSVNKSVSTKPPVAPAPAAAPTEAAPPTEAPAPATDGFVSGMRGGLAANGIVYTEVSAMPMVAKMATAAKIKDAIKFKSADATVLMISLNDGSGSAAVQAEINTQMKAAQAASASVRIAWLEGNATHLVVANYMTGSEPGAQKMVEALGGMLPLSLPPTAPAPVTKPVAVPVIKAEVTNGTAFKVGDKVLGDYHNGSRWYVGKISGIDGPAISVAYDDGSKETLGPLNVAHFPTGAAKVVVGSKVVAKWSSGSFYGGKVTAVSGSTATVAWTDGSAPIDVALTDMVIQGK